jgi:heme/copper-type cytochrome/quinol oxidase subunit 3
VGTLLLYAVVLGIFLLHRSRLQQARPDYRRLVPSAAGASFYVSANLFLLILGRGRVSRWAVLTTVGVTLALSTVLSLGLRAEFVSERIGTTHGAIRRGLAEAVRVRRGLSARQDAIARAARFAGMTLLEEAVKLAAVFALIRRRRIRTAQGAMLCGALAGLTFGTVEGISYGYLIYPAGAEAVTAYLTRFFVMSPLHGIWDGLAGALVFFLSAPPAAANGEPPSVEAASGAAERTRPWPGAGAFAAAYAVAVVLHVTHNALQQIVGPTMQIVTVFALLAPLYYAAKLARRQARDGADKAGLGDLHLLTVSLAAAFFATSVTFSWVLGVDAAGNAPHASGPEPAMRVTHADAPPPPPARHSAGEIA